MHTAGSYCSRPDELLEFLWTINGSIAVDLASDSSIARLMPQHLHKSQSSQVTGILGLSSFMSSSR
jgi:hypothetical protein